MSDEMEKFERWYERETKRLMDEFMDTGTDDGPPLTAEVLRRAADELTRSRPKPETN